MYGASDAPHFDLTPPAERAIHWLAGLEQDQFIGAESRLQLVFDLLHQIAAGTDSDPLRRIAELERRRDLIDSEIARIRDGRLELMGATPLRERFLHAIATARELLADFRQVEHNFRKLDREVRERMTVGADSKGQVREGVFADRDSITDSDQGRSFRAFWDFLMSPARQEELTEPLARVLAPEAELTSLRGRHSNIPANSLEMRERICHAVGLTADALPFVGELVQVRDSERDWEGAIERLMHNFGLSLLVPDQHYQAKVRRAEGEVGGHGACREPCIPVRP